MNFGFLKKAALKVGEDLIKHNQEILLASGIITTVAASAFAVKATIKSTKDVQDENLRLKENDEEPLTKKEIVKREGKNYILTFLFLAASLGCQFGGYKASVRRIAALSAALKISEEAYEEYKKDIQEAAEKLAPEELKTAISNKSIENNSKDKIVDNLILAGDTDYIIRVDGYRLKRNISELKLDLETFRSNYYLSGYQDPITVADLHDYLGIHVSPSDYDRKIDFTGSERWYDLDTCVENSHVFVDVVYTTRDLEKY